MNKRPSRRGNTMVKCKKCVDRIFLCTFILALVGSTVIVLMCFISCPILMNQLKNSLGFNYVTALYSLLGFVVFVIFTSCAFCVWRKYASRLCFDDSHIAETENALPYSRQNYEMDVSNQAPLYETKTLAVQPKSTHRYFGEQLNLPIKSEDIQDELRLSLKDVKVISKTNVIAGQKISHYFDPHSSNNLVKRGFFINDFSERQFNKSSSNLGKIQYPVESEAKYVPHSSEISTVAIPLQQGEVSRNSVSGSESDCEIGPMCNEIVNAIEKQDEQDKKYIKDILPPPLSRNNSYQGLPGFNAFNDYLHLVNIQTPLSPKETFFQ